ncbi:odorant receptor 2a-like [Spodoptera litura]|uniref:Odorant receptor n=1 Tax=Spodoptera litura TaxID=69820 RepID=A0A9J7E0V8_SPOLT|nr:odorant receptor 2a-like [Spodoptera litura]
MEFHRIDCFNINLMYFKFLGVWPGNNPWRFYNYYSKAFIMVFVIIFILLFSINFYFLPRQLNIFIEETIIYFTDLAVTSKVLTFVFMHKEIIGILDILECDLFQPEDDEEMIILENAKKSSKTYCKIIMIVSYLSSTLLILSPLISHLILGVELLLPICRYAFISDEYRLMFIYPIYLYQIVSIHFHVLYNVNVDIFFFGLMVLAIAQLDILDRKLRKVTEGNKVQDTDGEASRLPIDKNKEDVMKINQCIIHFIKVCRFCELIEDAFSATLFVQYSAASCIICVCLCRFTMPAEMGYIVFLASYMSLMVLQMMAPCWLGTRLMDKSQLLAFSVYNCDWTSRSRHFKSNMRFFVDRANKPLSITGGKMFNLSLGTFTSIMNSAYSFFTLLQHFQKE